MHRHLHCRHQTVHCNIAYHCDQHASHGKRRRQVPERVLWGLRTWASDATSHASPRLAASSPAALDVLRASERNLCTTGGSPLGWRAIGCSASVPCMLWRVRRRSGPSGSPSSPAHASGGAARSLTQPCDCGRWCTELRRRAAEYGRLDCCKGLNACRSHGSLLCGQDRVPTCVRCSLQWCTRSLTIDGV